MDNKNNDINNQTPLESVTIGTVNQNKTSFVLIIVLLVIFIGIIYFLPDLNNLYQKYIGGSTISGDSKKEPKKEEIIPKEDTYLLFEETDTQEINNLVFSSVKHENGKLSFSILNKNDEKIDLEKNHYFMVLYNNDKEVASFLLDGEVSSNNVKSFSFNSDANANAFYVNVIEDGDYPIYEVVSDKEGISYINCKKEKQVLTYTFKDNLLVKVKDYVKVAYAGSTDYNSEYNSYNLLAQNFSFGKIKGAVANLNNEEDGFSYNLDIDYNELISSLNNNLYFAKSASTSKVMYEMSARGYNCY